MAKKKVKASSGMKGEKMMMMAEKEMKQMMKEKMKGERMMSKM